MKIRHHQGGFSLIEILTVIAIISILMAFLIAGLGSDRARKLTTAGNMTVDMIHQTKQIARAHRTLAMIAVVSSGADAYRALGIFSFSREDGNWRQEGNWRILPQGIMVDATKSNDFLVAPPPTVTGATFQRGGQIVTCLAAVFLPDGRVQTTSDAPQVLQLRMEHGMSDNFYKVIVTETGTPVVRRP